MKAIRAEWLICSWKKVIFQGVLVWEKNRIIATLTPQECENWLHQGKLQENQIMDRTDSIVFPGFVNAHMHQYGILSHGIPQMANVTDFESFLSDYWWPYIENRIRKEQVMITAKATMAEMLHSGITSFCDILEAPETEMDTLIAQGELIRQTGMRGIVGLESSERISRENGERCLLQNQEAVTYFQENPGLVRGSICTHTTFSCSEDFIQKAAEMARESNAQLQFHLSESKYEPQWLQEKKGECPVNLYERKGGLSRNTIATQCVKINREEIDILAKNHVPVVHMPISNCEVGGGIAPVPQMLEKGITVALGTDGYINDFFWVMKAAFLIHKAAQETTDVMPAAKVFQMATEYGAKVMQLSDCGTLEAEKKADFVVYRMENSTPIMKHNIFEQLVVFGESKNVSDVYIGGTCIMRDGVILTLDEDKVKHDVKKCAEKFWREIELK